jgi:glyoxylase-like metal-dependent hydrolase (beta-lactamase superfamily II)
MKVLVIPVTAYQQNCSLIWCERTHRAALVDPGGDVASLLAQVEKHGLTLERLLITHGHLGHAGGVAELTAQLGLPVEGPHLADQFWIDGMQNQARMFGFPPTQGFTPTRWLNDGDRVTVGEEQLEVLHCPGHTPGHVVFFHRGEQLAFVGDVLFQGSIGRTDFPQGDHRTLIASIQDKLLPLGDEVSFVPGHGPASTFGHERRHNPYLQG